jgi:hypothetical protein
VTAATTETLSDGDSDAAAAAEAATAEELVRSREADYAHFAELVATVMIVREGGVDAALEAVPILHDSTDAYISALTMSPTALLSANGTATTKWSGLSAAAAALIAQNYTALQQTDPFGWKAAGNALGSKVNNATFLDPLLAPVTAKLKSNATVAKLNAVADAVILGRANDAALIQELNDQFANYNVEFKGKSIGDPTKFSNAASVISKAITGVSLSATAINFAPCLVSISPTAASASFELIK